MSADIVLSSAEDGERNDGQRKQRQEVDGAPRSPHPDRMDEQRRSRDQDHQQSPSPTDRSVRERPLWGQKLHSAETDRGEGESGVKLDERRSIEKRGERHGFRV